MYEQIRDMSRKRPVVFYSVSKETVERVNELSKEFKNKSRTMDVIVESYYNMKKKVDK